MSLFGGPDPLTPEPSACAVSTLLGDPRHDESFFGRTDELYQLIWSLQHGRHTLLVGEKGIGKSRLMLEARRVLTGRMRRIDFSATVMARLRGQLALRIKPDHYKVLFVEHAAPLGECLKEMAEQLYYNGHLRLEPAEEREDWPAMKKRLTALGSVRLQAAIFEAITRSERPYLIFFDQLDRISPSHQAFLEAILNIAVVSGAVVHMKEQFIFKRIWASFARIEVGPLPEPECIQLIDYLVVSYAIRVIDPVLYRREILKSANGNPFQIKNLIWHGSRERHLGVTEIRSLRRVEDGAYFNMGPLYIFSAGVFTLFKIFSLGTDNQEFYIYFSALGFLVFLTFRVFRAFFLFRPQKVR